jgi:hypothetical protein
LIRLKYKREMARKKAEISKEPKDVQTQREKAAVVKREIVSSKKQAFRNFLKNLDYRKNTSKVHKFISTLNNKCEINNTEPLNSKNSIEYKDKKTVKAFTSFYTSADHIPKYLEEQEKYMKHPTKEKCRITTQGNIFNTDFKPHELSQAIASSKTGKSPDPDHIMTEFLKHLGPVAFDTLLQFLIRFGKQSSNVEESNHHSSTESQKNSFRTIHLLTNILNEYPTKNYGKNGRCEIELVSGNPKSPITSTSKLQEIFLNKSTNCYA